MEVVGPLELPSYNMTADYNSRLKMLRAHHHLEQLQTKWSEWFNEDRYTITTESDRTLGFGYTAVKAVAESPPIDPFGLIIGDCVQNMRSGLDHLIFDLAEAFTKPLPPEIEQKLQFPIMGYEDRQGRPGIDSAHFYRTGRGGGLYRIEGVNPLAHTVIEGFQPYRRRDQFRVHPLWILHELSNIDKHRLVHPVIGYFTGIGLRILDENWFRPHPDPVLVHQGVLEGETVIAHFPFQPEDYMKVKLILPLEIAFDSASPVAAGERVIETLTNVYNYVAFTVFPALGIFL